MVIVVLRDAQINGRLCHTATSRDVGTLGGVG